ncbi:MAG TPA: Na+/H+ antiporter [Rhizomicrobium sp.]|nr:Na+/H+ antiporter [Rhizomicrobium sp.]
MEIFSIVLVMLLGVVFSGAITRLLPIAIPLPLVQIAFGMAISAVAGLGVRLEPEIFFLLFIPPLLFLDGWRIPKTDFFRDLRATLQLSIGLVLFTVAGMGFFIHWMIPNIPLAVAFALSAILSPTDPVAVSAIAARAPIPKRVMHLLEGESLLNDASGLVCMRFALAAALTGTFSFTDAVVSFVWLALGGVAIGAAFTWAITTGAIWLSKRFGEDTGTQIIISLLVPFGAYQLAEHLGCSGILAAVAAGITMSYAELSGAARGETRMQRVAVWNTVQSVANGAMFILLGEQLPGILKTVFKASREAGHGQVWLLGVYVVAITTALILLRYLWVWTSLKLTVYRAVRRGETPGSPSRRLVAAMSVAGVRGAITLAGVLTFPLTMLDDTAFPARDLSIFLAAGVIVLSLLLASFALPRLLVNLPLPPEDSSEREEEAMRNAAAKAALQAVETARQTILQRGPADPDLYTKASDSVTDIYRTRLGAQKSTAEEVKKYRDATKAERSFRLTGLKAEREEIFRHARNSRASDEVVRKLIREIDLLEARLGH